MYKLSMFQVVSVTCTTFLPVLAWVFPRLAAYYGGVDGQWAVLGVCVLGIFSAFLHGLLNHRFRRTDGGGMLVRVFGTWLGKAIALIYVPGYTLFIAISLYSFSIAVKPLLPNTPRLAIVLILVMSSTSGALYGLESIARVAALVVPVTVFMMVFTYFFIFLHGSWTGVFLYPVSFSTITQTVTLLLPMFFGLNLYMMMSPYYDHRKRNSVWLPVLSVGICSLLIIMIYVGTIRVVGYEGVRVLTHPIDFVMQLVELHDVLLQRLGTVLIFILTMFEGVFFASHLWGMAAFLVSVYNAPKARQKWFTLSYAVLCLITFMLIPNQQVWEAIVKNVLVPLSWLYLIIEPIVKLSVAFIRKVGDPADGGSANGGRNGNANGGRGGNRQGGSMKSKGQADASGGGMSGSRGPGGPRGNRRPSGSPG